MLLTGFSCVVSAQTIFAPPGAKWYYSGGGNEMYGPDTTMRYILLEVEKDTVVGTQTWKKLSNTEFSSFFGPASPLRYDTTYRKPIFIHSSGDTVYYYNEVFQQLLPLYIFNVAPGDTLIYYAPDTHCFMGQDSTFQVVVDSVTVFYADGEPLQQVWTSLFEPYASFYMTLPDNYIERIGFLSSFLLSHICGVPIPEHYGPSLRCYSDDLITYQRFANWPCDTLVTTMNIADRPYESANLQPYPNPVVDRLYFTLPTGNDITIRLTDINGRLLEEQDIKNRRTTSFDVKNYAPGIYLYQVIMPQGIHPGKVLIGK